MFSNCVSQIVRDGFSPINPAFQLYKRQCIQSSFQEKLPRKHLVWRERKEETSGVFIEKRQTLVVMVVEFTTNFQGIRKCTEIGEAEVTSCYKNSQKSLIMMVLDSLNSKMNIFHQFSIVYFINHGSNLTCFMEVQLMSCLGMMIPLRIYKS